MIKKIITGHIALLSMTLIIAGGVLTVNASEVTGTLSSSSASNESQTTGDLEGNVSGDSPTSGNIEGTVGGSNSSSGGGSRSGGSEGLISNAVPAGLVLGFSTYNTESPGFPNTGIAPEIHSSSDESLWSELISFLKNTLSL